MFNSVKMAAKCSLIILFASVILTEPTVDSQGVEIIRFEAFYIRPYTYTKFWRICNGIIYSSAA
jgi:hypothetical protein